MWTFYWSPNLNFGTQQNVKLTHSELAFPVSGIRTCMNGSHWSESTQCYFYSLDLSTRPVCHSLFSSAKPSPSTHPFPFLLFTALRARYLFFSTFPFSLPQKIPRLSLLIINPTTALSLPTLCLIFRACTRHRKDKKWISKKNKSPSRV